MTCDSKINSYTSIYILNCPAQLSELSRNNRGKNYGPIYLYVSCFVEEMIYIDYIACLGAGLCVCIGPSTDWPGGVRLHELILV